MENMNKKIVCPLCEKNFSSKAEYMNHVTNCLKTAEEADKKQAKEQKRAMLEGLKTEINSLKQQLEEKIKIYNKESDEEFLAFYFDSSKLLKTDGGYSTNLFKDVLEALSGVKVNDKYL